MRRRPLVGLLAAAGLGLLPAVAAAEPTWRLEQPDPPAGAAFKVPLGAPGDLQFWAPNRGLLAVEGNETVPRGLLFWDGATWSRLSTVCGGTADATRIVWAGPEEFWTITEPSRPRAGAGTSLCHFAGGQVVASYSTADGAADPYRQMLSGACNGPSDCWFAGVGAQDATGRRVGGFHLRWDGSTLRTSYAPQGRAVTDVAAAFGTFWESTVLGARPGSPDPAPLAQPETPAPLLLHRFTGSGFAADPFAVGEGAELLALSATADELWAAGGGAGSGPTKPATGIVERPPYLARRTADGWSAVGLDADAFKPQERFVDVAAGGPGEAWAAVQAAGDGRSTNARARVARVSADGTTDVTTLPVNGSGRGAAARVAFPSATEGWLVTTAGWLFHYTDGTPLPVDRPAAFASLITFRPNEAAEQFVPDEAPTDDSQLFAPPPVEVVQEVVPEAKVTRLKPLLRQVKVKRKGMRLTVTFRLSRKARVGLVARRKGKVVARTKVKLLKPGKHALRLKLNRKRYPTGLKFITREPGAGGGGSADEDTVTT